MATIKNSFESARGCGFRKEGGKYLISGGLSAPCFKLPIRLTYCPCCGAGIKFSRAFQWISKDVIMDVPCSKKGCKGCIPFDGSVERFGLLWVGDKFYSPKSFTKEAAARGVSKRIPFVPKELIIGKTWILLAHKKAVFDPESEEMKEGIFYAFQPSGLEYIIKGDESEEELERLEKQGFYLINLIKEESMDIQFTCG
jgi:hypothetical protein